MKLLKNYSFFLSGLFVAVGAATIFWPLISTPIFQSALYILVGLAGVAITMRGSSASFCKWVGAAAVVLSIVGFAGLNEVSSFWQFGILWKWFYLVVGLLSLWIYLSTKPRETVA